MTPIVARKLAAALEHSADHDKPEDKRRTMFSVARALYEHASQADRRAPALPPSDRGGPQ
jgi:hypothetical protein